MRLAVVCALVPLATATVSLGAETVVAAPGAIDAEFDAAVGDGAPPRRRLVKWNEFDGPFSTLRLGFGFLTDFNAFAQDDDSKQQITMAPDAGVRDFRILAKGKFKTKRPLSWSIGYMYDGADKAWRFRQTGLMIGVPELGGRLFVGRTKEGYSLNKVMVGYHGWTSERSPALDAFVPILADGVKWMGYHPKPRIFYSLGVYSDELTEDEKFANFDGQAVLRAGWLPIDSPSEKKLLHVAVMGRIAEPDADSLQVRSRPEAYLAPYFLDTGKFAADDVRTYGVEAYYRAGPWLFGTEYNWNDVKASNGERPLFHAGNAVASWLITGESRPYNAPGGYFEGVSPDRTVFEGGPGALEAVLNFSYSDFDAGSFRGGTLWRLTPMINWHLSDNLRLELTYGYSVLDRFDRKGGTQFFQGRLQVTL